MLDEVLARRQEPTVLHHSGLEACVHGLDEAVVLGADLLVEGDHLLDRLLRHVLRQEVVVGAERPALVDRDPRAGVHVRRPGDDVDGEVREEEDRRAAVDLAGRVVGRLLAALDHGGAHRPLLRRDVAGRGERVLVGVDVDHR